MGVSRPRRAWRRQAAELLARERANRREGAEARVLAAGGIYPVMSRRTFQQWEKLHPEMNA